MSVESASRGADWELYASHREAFTQAVLAAPRSAEARLCVLGAGKCNDLDLARLTAAFRQVHLVDWEPASLASALSRESAEVKARLVPHAPVDLSLLTPKRTAKWRKSSPSPAELASITEGTLHGLLARLPGPFDVVVSACVLTQLGFALTRGLGERSPLLGPLRMQVLNLHLRTLLGLAGPNGSALLVTDLASSTHYPLAALELDADLEPVLKDVLERRAFYHLAEPSLTHDLLNDLAPARATKRLAPWLWNGPRERRYLVHALEISAESRFGAG